MDKIELTIIQQTVLGQIPRGSDKPAIVADISRVLGLDTREIYSVINSLTAKGIPICAIRSGENKGVFIPVTEQERADGLISLQNQVKEMVVRVGNVQKADLNWHEKLA